jgi:hypothetical protein
VASEDERGRLAEQVERAPLRLAVAGRDRYVVEGRPSEAT